MNPAIDFKESNTELVAPKNMTDDCSALLVWAGQVKGLPFVVSKWQPSKEDIDAINRGDPIYVGINAKPDCFTPMFVLVGDQMEIDVPQHEVEDLRQGVMCEIERCRYIQDLCLKNKSMWKHSAISDDLQKACDLVTAEKIDVTALLNIYRKLCEYN